MAGPRIITGEPGETYTNDTNRVLFQFHCSFDNSCGQCISLAGQIGPFWPIPIHRGCNCQNLPIPPGATANPFIDFKAEIDKLSPAQQTRVIGRSSLALVNAGVVEWGQVVTRARILPLKELVAKYKLTVPQMTAAGVKPGIAQRAYDLIHTPERAAQDAAIKQAIGKLVDAGATPQAISAGVAGRVAGRVGIRLPRGAGNVDPGPSNPGGGAGGVQTIPPLDGRIGPTAPLNPDQLEWAAKYLQARVDRPNP